MLRFLFFSFIFSLILISPTNADFIDKKTVKNNQFIATTLDFSQLKTTDNSSIETLFNIDNISPGGYQVNSLRIKNKSETDMNYFLTFGKIDGSDDFCNQLEINLIKDGQSKYQGPLVDLNLNINANNKEDFSDWLIYLKLSDKYVKSKSEFCDFNLNINAFSDPNQKSGFKYKRSILNHISSS